MFEQNSDIKKKGLKLISIYHQRSDCRKAELAGSLWKSNTYLHSLQSKSVLLVPRDHVFIECCQKL